MQKNWKIHTINATLILIPDPSRFVKYLQDETYSLSKTVMTWI